MTTSVRAGDAAAAGREERAEALFGWVARHRNGVIWTVVTVLVGIGLLGWRQISNRQGERVASQQLNSARLALDSKNYPLAASELSRISANYSGTRSANEATILLAQTRLAQGQAQQAIEVLKDYASGAPSEYKAQAFGLLGAAYENLGHPREAAGAYQQAADAAEMPFLKGQFLSDAGRGWLAVGDTSRARAAYQEIVTKLDSTSVAFEAKVRLGELGTATK
ncbi:MAG TPA: tetratricopeptide repeat protein [Gemmatimonadales bacterium]|nr:tetratricopeptide repeat protein [Gemmatimonadales bacterium]